MQYDVTKKLTYIITTTLTAEKFKFPLGTKANRACLRFHSVIIFFDTNGEITYHPAGDWAEIVWMS